MAIEVSSVNSFPAPRLDTRAQNLDVNENGSVTFDDLVRFKEAPILETAEPNTPQVDNFDVNKDGIVTTADIDNKFEQDAEASLRKDLGVAQLASRMDQIIASVSENRIAISTLNEVQSNTEETRLVDVRV